MLYWCQVTWLAFPRCHSPVFSLLMVFLPVFLGVSAAASRFSGPGFCEDSDVVVVLLANRFVLRHSADSSRAGEGSVPADQLESQHVQLCIGNSLACTKNVGLRRKRGEGDQGDLRFYH